MRIDPHQKALIERIEAQRAIFLRETAELSVMTRNAAMRGMLGRELPDFDAERFRRFIARTPDAELLKIRQVGKSGLAQLRRWQPCEGES